MFSCCGAGAGFYPANQRDLKSFQKALIGWRKAGPLKKSLLCWSCKQVIFYAIEHKASLNGYHPTSENFQWLIIIIQPVITPNGSNSENSQWFSSNQWKLPMVINQPVKTPNVFQPTSENCQWLSTNQWKLPMVIIQPVKTSNSYHPTNGKERVEKIIIYLF